MAAINNNDKNYLSELPPEVAAEVCKHLDLESAASFAMTCKGNNSIYKEHRAGKVEELHRQQTQLKKLEDIIRRVFPYNYEEHTQRGFDPLQPKTLHDLACMTTVEFEDIPAEEFITYFENLPNHIVNEVKAAIGDYDNLKIDPERFKKCIFNRLKSVDEFLDVTVRKTSHLKEVEIPFLQNLIKANGFITLFGALPEDLQANIQSLIPGFENLQTDDPITLMEEIQAVMKAADGILREQLNAITKFSCTDQNIPILPEGFFCYFPNLQVLRLDQNQIKELGEAFKGLINLQVLRLNQNQIKEIEEAFKGLINLQMLHLSRNQIKEIGEAFKGLIDLQELYLFQNQIEELGEAFKGLIKLFVLDLSQNQIKEIGEAFKGPINLLMLGLVQNQIEELGTGLSGLINLFKLDLDQNPIEFNTEEELAWIEECAQSFLYSHSKDELERIHFLTNFHAKENGLDTSDPEFGANNVLTDTDRFKSVMIRFYKEMAMQDLLNDLVESYDNPDLPERLAYHIGAIHAEDPGFQTDDLDFGNKHMFDDLEIFVEATLRVRVEQQEILSEA